MYNKKILKYKFKLNTTTDYMKKNIYKSKLNYYKLHNQIGGAAAAKVSDEESKLMQELESILVEPELIKIMNRFHTETFEFECDSDCKLKDHTRCFFFSLSKNVSLASIKNIILKSYIDLYQFTQVAPAFKELKSLKIAWGSHHTYDIPEEFNKFTKLEEIDCSNSSVVSIPALKNLVKLDCSKCKKLTTLPSLQNLEILIMTDTKIRDISHLFSRLKELDCSKCKNLDLSKSLLLTNIEKLNASNTGIKYLPFEMPFCKELNISNTDIEELPEEMPLCEKLNISSTRIREIPLTYVNLKIILLDYMKQIISVNSLFEANKMLNEP